jgi:hypothetical protein
MGDASISEFQSASSTATVSLSAEVMETLVNRLIGHENLENSHPDCIFAVKHQQIVLCEKNGCHTILKNSS